MQHVRLVREAFITSLLSHCLVLDRLEHSVESCRIRQHQCVYSARNSSVVSGHTDDGAVRRRSRKLRCDCDCCSVHVDRSFSDEKFRLYVTYNGTIVHRYIETVVLDCVFNLREFPFDVRLFLLTTLPCRSRCKRVSNHLCHGAIRTLSKLSPGTITSQML